METNTCLTEISINENYHDINNLRSLEEVIIAIDGIEYVRFGKGKILVEHFSQVLDEHRLIQELKGIGIQVIESPQETMIKRGNNPLKRYIQKLAAANEKKYGSRRLDCCDLNKKK